MEKMYCNMTGGGPVSVYVEDGVVTRVRPLQIPEEDFPDPWEIKASDGKTYSPPKAFRQIGAPAEARTWEKAAEYGVLPAEIKVTKGETLFPRIDTDKMLAELEQMNKPAPTAKPVLPDVSIDDFAKCDMRVCKILSCEAVKKSEKLLKFTLDDGSGTERQILSGIHKFYEPENLVGKKAVAILNLPPRKMMGMESNGMLLSALKEVDGKEELHLMIVSDDVPVGAQLC